MVIQNQTLFLLSQSRELYAIDLTDGSPLWQLNLAGALTQYSSNDEVDHIAYTDENTLILLNNHTVYAIDLAQARQSRLALAAQEESTRLTREVPPPSSTSTSDASESTMLSGVVLSGLTESQKAEVIEKVKAQQCSCGCSDVLADCECETAVKQKQEIVKQVKAGK